MHFGALVLAFVHFATADSSKASKYFLHATSGQALKVPVPVVVKHRKTAGHYDRTPSTDVQHARSSSFKADAVVEYGPQRQQFDASQIPSWRQVILVGLAVIGTAVLVDCITQSGYLDMLGCVSEICLIIFPGATALLTLHLGLHNLSECQMTNQRCGTPSFFVSSALNFNGKETWDQWLLRWYLWHLTVFLILCFKLRVLKSSSIRWLPALLAASMLGCIWSGFRNYSGTWTTEGALLHSLSTTACFILLWVETVVVWCRDSFMNIVYGALLIFGYLTALGISGFNSSTYVPEIFEWSLFAVHLVAVWYNWEDLEKMVKTGSWTPAWDTFCWFCTHSDGK
jgi:hypothetical protein